MPYHKYKKGEKHMDKGMSHKGMSQGYYGKGYKPSPGHRSDAGKGHMDYSKYKTPSGYAYKGSKAKRKALRRMMSMYKSGKYATGNVMPGAGNPKKIKAGYKKTKKKMVGAAYNHGA